MRPLILFVRRQRQAGQSLTEVVLLLTLIAIVAIFSLTVVGSRTATVFSQIDLGLTAGNAPLGDSGNSGGNSSGNNGGGNSSGNNGGGNSGSNNGGGNSGGNKH